MKILCLIGPSGSGKTTTGNILKEYGIPEIISHTTRKPRVGEINGVTYNFVSNKEFDNLIKIEEVEYSGNRYCTSKNEVARKLKLSSILFCIVTYDGYKALKEEYGESVVSVFINSEITDCIARMKSRGDTSANIERRIKNFEKMSEFENKSNCDYSINNTLDLVNLETEIYQLLCQIGYVKHCRSNLTN